MRKVKAWAVDGVSVVVEILKVKEALAEGEGK